MSSDGTFYIEVVCFVLYTWKKTVSNFCPYVQVRIGRLWSGSRHSRHPDRAAEGSEARRFAKRWRVHGETG